MFAFESLSYTTGILYFSTLVWVSCLWIFDSVQSAKQVIKAIPNPKAKTLEQETLSILFNMVQLLFISVSIQCPKDVFPLLSLFLLMIISQPCHCLGMDFSLLQVLELSLIVDLDGNSVILVYFQGGQNSIPVSLVRGTY